METPRTPTSEESVAPAERLSTLGHLAYKRVSIRHVWDVLLLSARGAATTQLDRTAAALTYRTLFSLVPVLVVGLAILGAFATRDQMGMWVREILDFAGLNQISLDQSPIDSDLVTFQVPGGQVSNIDLDQWIASAVSRVKELPFKTIGWIGTGVLIYAAFSMLVEVERAFNDIYHAPTGRNWLRRIVLYWTLLTLGPVFLLAGFFVRSWMATTFAQLMPAENSGGFFAAGVPVIVTTAISVLLFLVVYTTVPNTKVRFRPALTGAVFAAALWEAGKFGFAKYLQFTAGYATFYGSLAILPLFMLWVYLTWIIVLIGLQLSYTLQSYGQAVQLARQGGMRGIRTAAALLGLAPQTRLLPTVIDPASVLAIMAAVGERFTRGRSSGLEEISRETGLSEQVLEEVMRRLVSQRLLVKVDDAERVAYNLARPLESITAAELLEVGQSLCVELVRESDRAMLQRVHQHAAAAFAGLTLRDVMAQGGRGPNGCEAKAATGASPATA